MSMYVQNTAKTKIESIGTHAAGKLKTALQIIHQQVYHSKETSCSLVVLLCEL